jgi:3-methyladenine DNA glycosylase Tag
MHGPFGEKPTSLDGYLEFMTMVIMTAGISHKVVQAKWDGIKEALEDFDVRKIAALTPEDIDRLATDRRLIRNHKKIEAIADNAAMLLELDKGPGGFAGHLASLGGYEAQVADLRRNFRFLGPSSAHIFLAMVGEPVPESEGSSHFSHGAGAP